jgi:hypothetical protein
MWKIAGLAGLMAATLSVASPAAADDPSIHGFATVWAKSDYITPRGLHVHSDGSAVQLLSGLVVAFPGDPDGFITGSSVFGTLWADFNPGYGPPNTQSFNEFDWSIGGQVTIRNDWKLGVEYIQFISGPGAFQTEKNLEFSLSYSDKLEPVSINPYVKLFYAMEGDSTVVVGQRGDTFDVEIGAVPTIDLKDHGLPVILSAPTWITVGPEEFWGGGGNAGVFSTGVKVTYPFKNIPASAGNWSLFAGYQYYHLINDRLVLAQSILNPGDTDEDVHTWQFGVSMGF